MLRSVLLWMLGVPIPIIYLAVAVPATDPIHLRSNTHSLATLDCDGSFAAPPKRCLQELRDRQSATTWRNFGANFGVLVITKTFVNPNNV